MFIYVHIIVLPGIIRDSMFFRTTDFQTHDCHVSFKAQIGWSLTVVFVIFDLPIVIITLAYPLLYFKQCSRLRRKQQQNQVNEAVIDESSQPKSRNENHQFSVDPGRIILAIKLNSLEHSRSFIVATAMTVTSFLLWTPNQVYYTVFVFGGDKVTYSQIVDDLTSLLYFLQAVVDPLVFILTLNDLKLVLKELIAAVCKRGTWNIIWLKVHTLFLICPGIPSFVFYGKMKYRNGLSSSSS